MEKDIAVYVGAVKFTLHENETIKKGDLVWERDTHRLYVVKEVNFEGITLLSFRSDPKFHEHGEGLYKLKFTLPDTMN